MICSRLGMETLVWVDIFVFWRVHYVFCYFRDRISCLGILLASSDFMYYSVGL